MKSNIHAKRGIEITVTYLVILIVTILLFALSMYFLAQLREGQEDIEEALDIKTEKQIDILLKNNDDIVALPFSVKQTEIGQTVTFGIGIRNIGDASDFAIKVTFQGAYDLDGREIFGADKAYIEDEWVQTSAMIEVAPIARGEYAKIPILLRPDSRISDEQSTLPGEYAFNVCVYQPSGGAPPACIIDSQTNSMPSDANRLYPPNKAYTATIRIK